MEFDLNPQQKLAVQADDKPLLIVAGAGTGKTRTLTGRLAYLIEKGIPPDRILALTFTNKAAKEMAERVRDANLQMHANLQIEKFAAFEWNSRHSHRASPFIGTFHSLGARILRVEAKFLGRDRNFAIFDDSDSLQIIKKLLKTEILRDKESDYSGAADISRKISRMKNNVVSREYVLSSYPDGELVIKLFHRYEKELQKNNAFDFDDLIEKVVHIFKTNPNVLEKYKKRYRHILIDEYQDLNNVQYELIRLLVGNSPRLSAVGDDQQCVIPDTKITTSTGIKSIKDLKLSDKIIGASGNGETSLARILKIKKMRYNGPLIKISTRSGKTIRTTPNHILFSKLRLLGHAHFVYLMYRKDMGFRIGVARGSRRATNGDQIGLIVRSNQEKADKIWVLKVCSNRVEARYYEYFYSFTYGIPTVVFDTGNRNMKIGQGWINKLYQQINTGMRAKKLMEKELLYFNYPHWIPQGTIRHRARRLRARITLFDDKRKSGIHPWGMSRISINTKDKALKKEIENLGFKTRKGKLNDWRMEIAKLRYKEINKIASELERVNEKGFDVEFVRSACLTKKKRLFFQPASHIRPGMITASYKNREIVEEVIKKVEIENYKGLVYDIDVENIHNYIANNIVIHNSIYGFRGSNFRIFMDFEKDWPDANIILLEENYRSTSNIISAASALISNNINQKPKTLWTKKENGAPVKIIEADDEEAEAEWIAEEIDLRFKNYELGSNPKNKNFLNHKSEFINPSMAVLYRTNAQSRAIEQELIERGISYRIFGGLRFYERKEIKDIVAALRYAQNNKDEVSRDRLEKNIAKGRFSKYRESLDNDAATASPAELIHIFLESTGYLDIVGRNFLNADERRENIAELLHFASEFKELSPFLEQIALLQPMDSMTNETKDKRPSSAKATAGRQETGQVINLMTIHLAKGLEFDRVFIAGCNEGILPHSRALGTAPEIEEERRLMYVAMTRAKKELFLSFYDIPSRFLGELPNELVEFKSLVSDTQLRREARTENFSDLDDEERYITLD